ncbi:MAG TPA: hypothetical protein VGL56_15310, partial [Fimbriimonadaceae bacterium]
MQSFFYNLESAGTRISQRFLVLCLILSLATLASAQNAFTGLGGFTASALSKDGLTIVGSIQVSGNLHAAYWREGAATDLNIGT